MRTLSRMTVVRRFQALFGAEAEGREFVPVRIPFYPRDVGNDGRLPTSR
jgi:hypothetical protein